MLKKCAIVLLCLIGPHGWLLAAALLRQPTGSGARSGSAAARNASAHAVLTPTGHCG